MSKKSKEKNESRVNLILSSMKNHPILSIIIVLGIIVIAVGTFTNALSRIISFIDQTACSERNQTLAVLLEVKNVGNETIEISPYCEYELTKERGIEIKEPRWGRLHLTPEDSSKRSDILDIQRSELERFKAIFPDPNIYARLLATGAANLHIIIKSSEGNIFWKKSIPFDKKSIEESHMIFEINKAEPEGASSRGVLNELRERGLLEKICQARSYLMGGSMEGREKALRLYREVINKLSPGSKSELDKKLLEGAERDFKNKHNNNALSKYKVLFEPYYSFSAG